MANLRRLAIEGDAAAAAAVVLWQKRGGRFTSACVECNPDPPESLGPYYGDFVVYRTCWCCRKNEQHHIAATSEADAERLSYEVPPPPWPYDEADARRRLRI
jgi:hypothetical protein